MQPTSPLRALIADTATTLGPDAPTLCEPWTVRELLAHLVLRESRPDALPGIGVGVPVLRRRTEQVQERIARRPLAELAEKVRTGPPPWWFSRPDAIDARVNTTELAIHHEDMVRAQEGWEPTSLPGLTQARVWGTVRTAGRMLYRTAPTGVVAVADGYGRASLRRPPRGAGTVVLRGTPLELALHAFGRERVARLGIEGDDADLAALAQHRRSA